MAKAHPRAWHLYHKHDTSERLVNRQWFVQAPDDRPKRKEKVAALKVIQVPLLQGRMAETKEFTIVVDSMTIGQFPTVYMNSENEIKKFTSWELRALVSTLPAQAFQDSDAKNTAISLRYGIICLAFIFSYQELYGRTKPSLP